MRSKKSILNLIQLYKMASLRSDMADRIMYSTIPHFDPDRLYSTDVSALDRAVNGVKKLILIGTRVCIAELKHDRDNKTYDYNGYESYDMDKIYKLLSTVPSVVDQNTIKKFISLLNNIKIKFENVNNWEEMFGGKKWAVICESILKLAIEYEKYLNEKDYNKKIECGKMVITYMNVFDGLAHNSGYLYNNLLSEESNLNNKFKTKTDEHKNKLLFEKMMDAKELENPQDVVETIKPELELPIVFKKYLSKAHQQKTQNPNSLMSIEDRNEALRCIREKKQITEMLNACIKEIEHTVRAIKIEPIFFTEFMSTITFNNIMSTVGYIEERIDEFIEYDDYAQMLENIMSSITKFGDPSVSISYDIVKANINELYTKLKNALSELPTIFKTRLNKIKQPTNNLISSENKECYLNYIKLKQEITIDLESCVRNIENIIYNISKSTQTVKSLKNQMIYSENIILEKMSKNIFDFYDCVKELMGEDKFEYYAKLFVEIEDLYFNFGELSEKTSTNIVKEKINEILVKIKNLIKVL